MVVGGRQKSIAFFISLGAGMIVVTILLYVGWVVLDWQRGILLFFGFLMAVVIVAGVVLNTIFLVREIRRNEQHNAFINAVTHELKTPVASIRLYLETLLSRNVDEQTRAGFYRTMLDDSDRLLTLIEQVLRTGRVGPETKKLLQAAPVDLNALLNECIERARALHQLEPEALCCEPGVPITVIGDEDELRAAISNLLENAIKYSGKEKKVAAGIQRIKGNYATVFVRDEGIGIPKAELKRIFKRFYRVPGNAARRSGTGLGLFIVRSVAKRHGGRAWAESEGPGRGSRFVLELPAAR